MIDFKDLPKVAYEEMNSVHAQEVELLNTLESCLEESPQAYDNIDDILEEILDHTVGHFSNEERLMQEVGFPAYIMHKSEHDRVLNEMRFVLMDWRTKREAEILENYFFQTVPAWLDQHIASMDTITAQFICMRKGC